MITKRAYDQASKEARRELILDAAESLFAEQPDHLPAIDRIANSVGVAKGTIYLYFKSKEDIFASLLLRSWKQVIGDIGLALANSDDCEKAASVFIQNFVDFIKARPYLMRLDAFGSGILESGLPSERLADYKSAFVVFFDDIGTRLDTRLRLPPGKGVELMTRSQAIARGFWQTFAPARGLHVEAGKAELDRFACQLHDTLIQYWKGALNVR